MKIPARVLARFWDRVAVGCPEDCWPWKRSLGSHGYGQIGWGYPEKVTVTLAHRVAWVAVNGPILDELTVDHICRVRRCCNPAHMRLLTRQEHGRIDGLRWAEGSNQ